MQVILTGEEYAAVQQLRAESNRIRDITVDKAIALAKRILDAGQGGRRQCLESLIADLELLKEE